MKRIIFLLLTAVLAVPAASFAGVIGPARVHLVDGDVMYRTPDAEEWLPTSVNTPLDEGDALWAPAGSRAGVQFSDGTVVRIDGGSQLYLIAVEDGFTHLHLASGRLYLRTTPEAGRNSLQIDADDSTILPDARTRLRIDMQPNNQEDVSIFKGSAYVEGNGDRTQVRAGEQIALEEGHNELLPLNPPDSWEKWNNERDRGLSRIATSASNLPDELQVFSGELESNGRFISVPEYGMVWRPTVVLSDDWGPYRSGRWIWKGNDYVWVSYENWGWAPYHYGRWVVVRGFGWCWVPPDRDDVYWGPGYVGWYRTGNHIGWTPLAPGETFYGRRHYGRHSDTVANSNVSTANITYRNREARGGFSILLQNDFLRGRAIYKKPPKAAAVSVPVSLGSPRIQPVREPRMPIIKQMPPRVAPPVIQHHDNRELRDRFPRVIRNAEKQPHTQPPAPAAPPAGNIHAAPPLSRQGGDAERLRTNQPQPVLNPPVRKDQQQPPGGQADKHASPGTPPRQAEPPGQGVKQREQKQKKVWKVKPIEQRSEKDLKEKENKEYKEKK